MYMQPVFSKQDEPDWFEQTFGRCPHGSLATYSTSSTTIWSSPNRTTSSTTASISRTRRA